MTKPRGIIALFLTKPRGIIALFLTKPRGIMALFLTKPRGICAFPTAHTNAGNPTSILLFLRYESQRCHDNIMVAMCCDLLRFYYFCIMNLNLSRGRSLTAPVVICFDFIIFAL